MNKYISMILMAFVASSFLVGCNNSTNPTVEKFTPTIKLENSKANKIACEGCDLLKKGDYRKAKAKLESADKLGHNGATQSLGLMYINGHGVKKNYAKAMEYFKKAYKNGNINSAYDIGVMYKNGEGVKIDINKAKAYYLVSAKNNYGLAQFELAKIYAYEKKEKEFLFWAKKAYAKGYRFQQRKAHTS